MFYICLKVIKNQFMLLLIGGLIGGIGITGVIISWQDGNIELLYVILAIIGFAIILNN